MLKVVVASPRIEPGSACPARAGELRPGRPGLYYPLYYESILQKKPPTQKALKVAVASPRIELGSGASETLILSIVLRGRWSLYQSRRIGREHFYGNGQQNYAKKLSHSH